ncbi:MAG: hypothetical protein MJ175_05085 [Clostridia bacterium]|nr:hypothetical protein [Clostridia bacterium]
MESHTDPQTSYSDTQASYPVSDDNNPGNSNSADHTEQKPPAADDPIFQESPQSSPTITESIAAAIPCTIADGTLRITSLFQSTLLNPDCQDEYGDNIASLEILNISEHFIAEASFTITLDDGTVIPFSVTDLPAGKTVWVFAGNNAAIPINAICKNITCSVQTRDSVSLIQEGITCSVQNTEITVTNQTGTPLDHLTVRGHCLFENIYFGGKTYTYEISRLDAASSIVLSADDCIMGTIEIIGIDQTP